MTCGAESRQRRADYDVEEPSLEVEFRKKRGGGERERVKPLIETELSVTRSQGKEEGRLRREVKRKDEVDGDK